MLLARKRFSVRQMAIAIAIMAVISAMITELADSYKQIHHAYWAPIVERHAEEARLYSEIAASQPANSKEKARSLMRRGLKKGRETTSRLHIGVASNEQAHAKCRNLCTAHGVCLIL